MHETLFLPTPTGTVADLEAWPGLLREHEIGGGILVPLRPTDGAGRDELALRVAHAPAVGEGRHQLPTSKFAADELRRLFPSVQEARNRIQVTTGEVWAAFVRVWLAKYHPSLPLDRERFERRMHPAIFSESGVPHLLTCCLWPDEPDRLVSLADIEDLFRRWRAAVRRTRQPVARVVGAGATWVGSSKGGPAQDSDHENQDQYFWSVAPTRAVAAVADGVSTSGGEHGGYPAAALFKAEVQRWAYSRERISAEGVGPAVFHSAGSRISRAAQLTWGIGCQESRTAAALAWVDARGGRSETRAHCWAAGDVRLYHLSSFPGLRSEPDWWPSRLFADHANDDGLLSRSIPLPSDAEDPDYSVVDLSGGDVLVLASDGVYRADEVNFERSLVARCREHLTPGAANDWRSVRRIAWQTLSAAEPPGEDNSTIAVLYCPKSIVEDSR